MASMRKCAENWCRFCGLILTCYIKEYSASEIETRSSYKMQLTTKVLFVDGKRRIIEVIQLPQKVQLSQSAFNFNEEPPQSYMGFGPIVAFEGIKGKIHCLSHHYLIISPQFQ